MTDFSSRTARIPPRHHKRSFTMYWRWLNILAEVWS